MLQEASTRMSDLPRSQTAEKRLKLECTNGPLGVQFTASQHPPSPNRGRSFHNER